MAVTNYKGVIGDTRMGGGSSIHQGTEPDCHNTIGCSGLFYRNDYQEPVAFRKVTDGTSQTLMLGEDLPRHNYHSAAFYSNGDYASCSAPLNFKPEPPIPLAMVGRDEFSQRSSGWRPFRDSGCFGPFRKR